MSDLFAKLAGIADGSLYNLFSKEKFYNLIIIYKWRYGLYLPSALKG